MRTLVLSDIHLGNHAGYDIFAGGGELAALLRQQTREPTRIIFNGDTVDFLMNVDPLELEDARAVSQARAIAGATETAETFKALGEVLAAGGEAIIRLGNHDVELALPAVQAVFREALKQPAEVTKRLRFEFGDAPAILDIGGAKVLVTHGDHCDSWNKVDYPHLPDAEGRPPKDGGKFTFPSGSLLVKQLLNPLKSEYGMRFADLLKPDFQGAVLAALAVDPSAVKLAFSRTTFQILRQLFRDTRAGSSFEPGGFEDEEPDLGLADLVDDAGLTAAEREQLDALLGTDAVSFSVGGTDKPDSARIKLARAGLRLYSRFHKRVAAGKGDSFFGLEPDPSEVTEAERLATKYSAQAVLLGHSHAARWKQTGKVLYLNSGTWIWLMRLPDENASDQVWYDYLVELQQNPGLEPERQKLAKTERFLTVITLAPHPGGGADVALQSWTAGKGLEPLQSTVIPPA